jgi:hypothetical protein
MRRGFEPAIWAFVFGAAVAALVGCGPKPSTIVVTPAEAVISKAGGTVQLDVEVRDRRGAKVSGFVVEYRSRDPQVATVSSTGLVTAAGHGTTMVDVRLEGTDVMEFVRLVVRLPAKIEVRPRTAECHIGGLKQLSAEVLDHEGKAFQNVSFEWASSDESKARVENGEIVGVDEGEILVTAKALGLEGSSKVRITWAPGQKAMIEAEKRFNARASRGRGGQKNGGGGGDGAGTDPRLGMFR